jgi:hypothetical protein
MPIFAGISGAARPLITVWLEVRALFKAVIGTMLFRAKERALKVLDEEKPHAPQAISDLRNEIEALAHSNRRKTHPCLWQGS